MKNSQVRQVSEAVISSMTVKATADWYRSQGIQIIYHQGYYWKEIRRGFYEPIHLLARLPAEQATCPRRLYLGFRASLREVDSAVANGSIPIHLLSSVQDYAVASLSPNRRNHLRRCYKRAEIVQLSNPSILQEQGYEVLCSATSRFGGEIPSKKAYLAQFENHLSVKNRYIFAGLINQKLGGYLIAYVVDGAAYIEKVFLATEALSAYIGTGLVFEFAQACRRSGKVREIVYGYHTPFDSALSTFKEGMGFPLTHFPAKVQINAFIEPLIQWKYPLAYYVMTGHK